jgi:ATP-dependent RNA helicase RhlE
MGFLPEIRKILKHVPNKRQTLFFSATMPAPILALTRDMLQNPVSINLERQSTPATGITQAVYPVPQELKSALFLTLLERGEMAEALVFTRTKHRADRLFKFLVKNGITAERIHGNRSQPQRTQALAGFKSGAYRVLVATDIVARGIDITELGHVVNFDVPMAPADYVHRIGRTARAAATGDAFTFVSREEEGELRDIEKVLGRRLPRVTIPDFDYSAKAESQLEVPIAERIAAIRAQKAQERARAKAKLERKGISGAAPARPARPASHGGSGTVAGNKPGSSQRRRRGGAGRGRSGGGSPA